MDDKKEKKGFWQSWMTIATLLALTVMVFIFNSQGPSIRSEQDVNPSIGNITNIYGHDTNITGNGTGTNITGVDMGATDNDTYFKKMTEVDLRTIYESLKCISRAGQTQNFSETERCAKFLSGSSNISLRNANEYNVSPSIQTAMGDYKKALEYYNIGGIKLEIGARNKNASQMYDAIGYIQNGTTYVDRATLILYGDNTYNTTYNSSKKVNTGT